MNKSFVILTGIFAGSLTIAAVLASKIINVFGFYVPAGILAYSVTFAATDVISEIWGKKIASQVVLAGFFALVFVLALIQVAILWSPAPFWENQESFTLILGRTSRIIIGSVAAYLVSQFHDVWMFHVLKKAFNGRYLWLRNNVSTMISQFIDSFIFITIAFYGVVPIWPLILGQWVIKLGIAVLDTPVVYLLVRLLKKENTATKTRRHKEVSKKT
ncbi:MAG: queuosine precursor transporter [Candidatus Aminicenantes bacterium]|nr:queuosine precursor transporter [Candidatus Aminicenantes bacterium]NIM83695.1 queuosine precursor transporter [Candidatus Aminicenantes bacterium]NIN23120.1 queuosine precursor transporter [Candidatus Aminicenantes bacterium]NIN46847.1 queuosine precursor transporter [Candidatus Aminicenantes bacterium]NIN89769.1 queuosine precursor transporter [Candidatus Aminicenantes bacterium]